MFVHLLQDIFPIRDFAVGQKIKVFEFGVAEVPKRNRLSITHQNFYHVKECTLKLPPVAFSQVIKPSVSLMGFVKEVGFNS